MDTMEKPNACPSRSLFSLNAVITSNTLITTQASAAVRLRPTTQSILRYKVELELIGAEQVNIELVRVDIAGVNLDA